MKHTSGAPALATVAVLGLVLTGAGCATRDGPPGASPSPTTSGSLPPTPSASATISAPATVYGPVWPLEPRTLPAAHPAAAATLTAIRTGRHDTYDRLVLDFNRSFGTVRVRYVPIVHADPSDLTVPLQGNAFVEITIHDAYAGWAGQKPSYTGPASVTPGYPTLKQVTMSGDFENVLGFGAGIDRVAGFTIMRLRSPDRLVIDFAHRPAWQMWPDTSLAQARAVQESFNAGHVPWRGSVVAYYARVVYGWDDALITRISGTDEYWVSAKGSTERIRVRQVWPFQQTHRTSIAEIAGVR